MTMKEVLAQVLGFRVEDHEVSLFSGRYRTHGMGEPRKLRRSAAQPTGEVLKSVAPLGGSGPNGAQEHLHPGNASPTL